MVCAHQAWQAAPDFEGENQRRPSVASMMRWPQALVVATLARNCLKPPADSEKNCATQKDNRMSSEKKRIKRKNESSNIQLLQSHRMPRLSQQQYPGSWLFTPFKTLRLMQHPRKTWRPGLSLQNGSFFLWFQDVSSFKFKAPNLIPRIQIQTRAQLLSQGVPPWMAFQ